MSDEMWGVSLLWALVFIYGIAGSVDFGAGFWAMVFYRERDARAATIANRYLSPLWEVTNVFLVLFAVAMVGLFPLVAYMLGSVLLVPGSLILILLTIRSVFMVFAHASQAHQRALRVVSGLTGLLIPALLMTVLPVAQGGLLRTVDGHLDLPLGALFSSPTVYAYILLGLLSELFLSAMILADYSRVANDTSAFHAYRSYALWLGPLALLSALLALWSIPSSTAWLNHGLWAQWPWFVASAGCFAIGMILAWSTGTAMKHRFRTAVVFVVAQYALAMVGYGRAHMPYLVYPVATVHNSFTNSEIFRAAVVILIVGVAILFPGFVWFWRLFLENRAYVGKE